MSIQEYLNKIRNAVYGREVRESIAKGIETAYDDASEKDNANMEVKIARGTNPNLNTRLNNMDATDSQNTKKIDSNHQEVAAQLAQKASHGDLRITNTNVEGTNKRIDNLVIPISPENVNVEVTDAHVSVPKAKTFDSLTKRFEDGEEEVLRLRKNLDVPLYNIALNGNFAKDTDENGVADTYVKDNRDSGSMDNIYEVVSDERFGRVQKITGGINDSRLRIKMTHEPLNLEHKYYQSVYVKASLTKPWVALFSGGKSTEVQVDGGKWVRVSHVATPINNDTNLYVTGYLNNSTLLANHYLIDLTASFGAGKEPTVSEMDELLDFWLEGKWFGAHKDVFSKDSVGDKLKGIEDSVGDKLKGIEDSVGDMREDLTTGLSKVEVQNNRSKDMFISSSQQFERKPILTFTFDDEATTIYDYALPIFEEESAKATFFVVASRPGTGKLFDWGRADSWERIKEMDESGVIKIENHTLTHAQLRDLTREEVNYEFEKSNEIFESKGIKIKHHAYPFGYHNDMVKHVAQDYFHTARGVTEQSNDYELDPMLVGSYSADSRSMEWSKRIIDSALEDNNWVDFYLHGVHPDGIVTGVGSKERGVKTPEQIRELIQYARSIGVDVVSYDEAVQMYAPVFSWTNLEGEIPFRINRNGTVNVSP